jgi:hypothetical protein
MRKYECDHDTFVDGCAACAEIAAIARAFVDDRNALAREVQIPSSAIVWWRAQMRSRREAVEAAAQPMTWAQGLALACAAGILVAAVGFFAPTFMKALEWAMGTSLPQASFSLPTFGLPEEPLTNPIIVAFVAALGISAIVLPVVLYFTLREE